MGKVRMGILDGFKGKVGTVVGSFWKGKKVMRAYNEFPTNPRTSAQLIQRQKFALIASLGGVFTDFLKMTLRGYANGEQNSLIGQFVGQNINSVNVSGSTVEVDYETLSLTPPKSPLTAVALGEVRVRPVGPCVLLCATDGCFGYLKSPMEFEHLLLSTLEASKSVDAWQEKLERVLDEIAGDDQSLAAVIIGYGSFAGLRRSMKPRLEALETMVAGFGDSYEARLAAWEREKAAYYRLAGGGAPKEK